MHQGRIAADDQIEILDHRRGIHECTVPLVQVVKHADLKGLGNLRQLLGSGAFLPGSAIAAIRSSSPSPPQRSAASNNPRSSQRPFAKANTPLPSGPPSRTAARIAQERLGPGRIHHCMRWIGICNRAFDLMCSRASKRIIQPDGKTLATKQIIQAWIAECAANIQAARLMTLNAAWKIETLGAKAARYDISFIKFFVANVMQDVIDKALQVHGGMGMTDDTIIAYFYRHERAARIYDGADEVHKMSVARRILRNYEGRTVR